MASHPIPRIDVTRLFDGDVAQAEALHYGVTQAGFLTVYNTAISADRVRRVLAAYHAFFTQPAAIKQAVDMARTGANRGWGGPMSEQVDPTANPDYKEVFDIGYEVPGSDLRVHGANLWPATPEGFRQTLEGYYAEARALAQRLLGAIAGALGEDPAWFAGAFDQPMALLRGNYYPPRPVSAGARDYGIAPHTDYGCLTLLASDGTPGLEVRGSTGDWLAVTAQPGEFVINFGEMLDMWSNGRIKATLHQVRGSTHERLSIPLFFNPDPETNVAPLGSGRVIHAVDHLQRRYDETYVHLQDARSASVQGMG